MGFDGYRVDANSSCRTSNPKKLGQFFVGKTIFAELEGGTKCTRGPPWKPPWKESYTTDYEKQIKSLEVSPEVLGITLKELFSKFKSYPEKTIIDADKSNIKNTAKLINNFAGDGISLYTITLKNGLNKYGFLYDEVKLKYPKLCKKIKGKECIIVRKSDIKNNKGLKRIYLLENSKDVINTTFSDIFHKKK